MPAATGHSAEVRTSAITAALGLAQGVANLEPFGNDAKRKGLDAGHRIITIRPAVTLGTRSIRRAASPRDRCAWRASLE